MKVFLIVSTLALALAACASPTPPATNTPLPVPTVATATPIVLTRQEPSDANRPLTANCELVTRGDMAGIFGGEVNQPMYQGSTTNVLPFSNTRVSADEYVCIYFAFHNSGSVNGTTYQITYWVDRPGSTPANQWAQAWNDSKSGAAQSVSGVGDDAFYKEGRLTFKKGNAYVTIEVLATKMDTNTTEGMNQQIDLEKKVALKALMRWQ